MKKILLLSFLAVVISAKAQIISFDDTSTFTYIKIDTAYHNNIWQAGKPDKVLFNSAHSVPNAIVTDTINPYSTNNNSVFILRAVQTTGTTNFGLQFNYKINTDSLNDYGTIEASPDNGITWINIIKDAQSYGFFWNVWNNHSVTIYSSQNNDTLPFTGTSNGWYSFTFSTNYAGPLVTSTYLLYRITFHSDNIQTNKEGWMIDDISAGIWESIKELDNVFPLTIFPNPTSSEIQLIGNQSSVNSIEIYNMIGERIYTLPFTDNRSPITINISAFPSGMYFAKIKSEKGVAVKKFIKE
ncbi:MAG: T9SS type A sorting domain-containing protein [Bacteroidales bacterium]|jgi:hypothetical protein